MKLLCLGFYIGVSCIRTRRARKFKFLALFY